MMFDDTIKLYATSADDNHRYGDETEDDDQRARFGDDDEEEEVTMTSDDDEELEEEEGTAQCKLELMPRTRPSSRCLLPRLPAMSRQPNRLSWR